ncbi:MAG: hypothetical protein E7257_03535 [Lachnospiraceae bacterium]|nr:hypothetical protein [Lachnospiraceae bacterium]
MERWEIQQRINTLESRRAELEEKISKLEGRKERLELEQAAKLRDIENVSDLYSERRTTSELLYEGLEGVAATKAAGKLGEIYSIGNQEALVSKMEDIIYYLKKCCEKADADIEDARLEISNIDCQLYDDRKALEEME